MILIISAVFPPEPVVSATLSKDIADELSTTHNVVVLHPKPTRPVGCLFGTEKLALNYETVMLDSFTCPEYNPLGRLRESYSFGRKCARYIRENAKKIDVIYLNAWPLFAQYWIVKTAKQFGIPCVIHVQDIYPESFTNKLPAIGKKIIWSVLLPLDKFILKNSKQIIAISNSMKQILQHTRKIGDQKISVVYNWQDENRFLSCKNEEVEREVFTFMYLGNLSPYSCIDVLIDAFSKLNNSNVKLVIAGSGSAKESLQKQAKSLSSKVEFIDAPNKDVPEIQSSADILLLSVKTDGAKTGMPSKLPAYMFSCKPIIASIDSDSDAAEAIVNSNCGWIIEPENADALADKMKEVTRMNKSHLIEMGSSGCKYALNHFSKKNNVKKITELITKTICQ